MIWRLRLLAAFGLVLTVPLAVALVLVDVSFADELLIFGVAVLGGLALALLVSGVLLKPLRRLASAADRLASDDLEAALAVRVEEEELGELAVAFNRLRDRLLEERARVSASHGEVRESVRRLGEALRSIHDMTQMLSVVLETALVAVQGKAGAVYMVGARRSHLYVKVGRHLDPVMGERRIEMGQGIAGWVAQQRAGVRYPDGAGAVPVDPEPTEATILAAPLETPSQLLGVLAIYGRTVDEPFTDGDLEVITSLARQAGVGIENVLLHQEAQRLSITDGLTGVWNRRFFQMRLTQEFERAARFERPFSVLMIDIDHFKGMNDRYGHQRGDAILIELAQRIVSHTRIQVDTLARYGGEEFVLILPETGAEGARTVAEKIRAEIADRPFESEGDPPLEATVSIGFAAYPAHGATTDELVHAADRAMYLAKARGRNRIGSASELDEGSNLATDPARP